MEHTDMEDTFSEQLLDLRKQLKWSRIILSSEMDIPYNTFKQWESGSSKPSTYFQKMIITTIKNMITIKNSEKHIDEIKVSVVIDIINSSLVTGNIKASIINRINSYVEEQK